MHVVSLLKANMFDIRIDGAVSSIGALFPDWHAHDRFGLVIDEAFGGIGATHLLQSAMMAYYDVKPSRRTSLAVYPEIYAFHIGRGHGAHAPYDFWPARREVILETADHREILDAINDRGITRLAVPDRPMREVVHRPKEEDAALDRIASAFVYSATGRVDDADVVIAGNDRRTEHNPKQVLRPIEEMRALRAPAVTGRPLSGHSPAELVYARYVEAAEADFASALTSIPGASVVGTPLRTVYGGVRVELPANRIDDLVALDEVVAVQQNRFEQLTTDSSPTFIGADTIYAQSGGAAGAGAGVIVGILDSGVWPEHPSLLDLGNLGTPPEAPSGEARDCNYGDNPLTPS